MSNGRWWGIVLATMIWTTLIVIAQFLVHRPINPAPERIATPTSNFIAPEPVNGDVYELGKRDETYVVCVPTLAVKNNPGDQFPALFELRAGDQVYIRERSRGTLGWARIGDVLWVHEQGLCRG